MRFDQKWRSLDQVISLIVKQIYFSVPFAERWLPVGVNSAPELYHILKANTSYHSDPAKIELLQSFPSLMQDNYWGIPGAGDCDCLTIAAAACAQALNFDSRLILAGNKDFTHIYNLIEGQAFDLTENSILAERKYRKYQLVEYLK